MVIAVENKPRPMRVLVLYWHDRSGPLRLAIQRHLQVLDCSTAGHEVLYYNALDGAPSWLRRLEFDAIILHTTYLCLRWSYRFYDWKWKMRWINEVRCVKVAVPQDEYDHAEVLDEWLHEMGVGVIFTNFGPSHRALLYPVMSGKAKFYECLTGYFDEHDVERLRNSRRNISRRALDVVYRATHLPYWFGSHGQMKHRIGEAVAARAGTHGLRCDISTGRGDVIVGPRWLDFLASGRTVIGCESGSSVLDRRGEIRSRLEHLAARQPFLSYEESNRMMSPEWDRHSFGALSPRHLEAVTAGTCQLLVEGTYSDVLRAHEHYLPIKADFSNLDQVLDRVKDPDVLQEVADRAYRDVYESGRYTYGAFAKRIEGAIEEALPDQRATGRRPERSARFGWNVVRLLAGLSERARFVRVRAAASLRRVPMYWGVIRHPLVHAARAYLMLRLVLSHPPSRALFLTYWTDMQLKAAMNATTVWNDLFMIRLMRKLHDGEVRRAQTCRVTIDADQAGHRFIFRTRQTESGAAGATPLIDERLFRLGVEGAASGTTLAWDHSAVASQVLYPVVGKKRLAVRIGLRGVYTFPAFPALASRYPEQARRVLTS
jgi:hypothetical protein